MRNDSFGIEHVIDSDICLHYIDDILFTLLELCSHSISILYEVQSESSGTVLSCFVF